MHSRGVIHCDIKSDNIVLDEALKTPILLDFELSKEANDRLDGSLVAQSTLLHGTMAYWAPELRSGEQKRPTDKSDVFALGRVLYELFFPGSLRLLDAIIHLSQLTFSSNYERINIASLRSLISGMLDSDPSDRLTAAAALNHSFFTGA